VLNLDVVALFYVGRFFSNLLSSMSSGWMDMSCEPVMLLTLLRCEAQSWDHLEVGYIICVPLLGLVLPRS
jgi:hypothetical protein